MPVPNATVACARLISASMPQIGSGRGSGPDGYEDYGREQVTGDEDDILRFRTPRYAL